MKNRCVIIAAACAMGTTGCQPRNESLAQIQFCLTEGSDSEKLKAVFQELGRSENITYFDWSSETQKLLEGSDNRFDIRKSFPIINIGLRRKDGLGVGGGNAGFPAEQVAFGFTSGTDLNEARRFSRRVVNRLTKTWTVHYVPPNKGAFPLNCG